MGIYIKLGRTGALWMEWRKEWIRQPFQIERHNRELVLSFPWGQMILTPP